MGRLLTLDDLNASDLTGRRVFVRVDFNVQVVDGRVLDATRLEMALPTLRELSAAGARVILASHRGRPKGAPKPEFSLRPVAAALAEMLGRDVAFAEDCVGPAAQAVVEKLDDGEFALLENLRFHAGEEANDGDFAAALASLAEVFVNDAFGTAHRAHASVVGVADRLERRSAGRLMAREVEVLGSMLDAPRRPFAAVIGGAKIAGKSETLSNLLPRLDLLVLGGGMANTFLAAQGYDLADSLVEEERIDLAKEILAAAEARNVEVLLPNELVVADSFDDPQRIETVAVDSVPAGMMALDVGPAFCARVATAVAHAGTIFWNGPLGVFEQEAFAAGTAAVARALTDSAAYTVVGGGETVAAAKAAGVAESLGFISTGGGAALELLAGKALPGVAALETALAEATS